MKRGKPAMMIGADPAIMVLVGCELAPPPTNAESLQGALPEGIKIPSICAASGVLTFAVNGNWVASFRDRNIIKLVQEGLQNNRDLVAAAAPVEATLQTAVITGAPLLR